MVCATQRLLPVGAGDALVYQTAFFLGSAMGYDTDFLVKQLLDETLCDAISAARRPQIVAVATPDILIPLDAEGDPMSMNPTWNACYKTLFSGYMLKKEDIRNNPDKDKDGTPRDCAYYFELSSQTAYFPDYSIYITVDGEGNVAFPAGYAVDKRTTVAAK